MSRLHPPVAYGTYATRFVIAFVFVLVGLAGGTTHATSRPAVGTSPMVVRVLDSNGRPQSPATAIACPYVGATNDCTHAITQQVGPLGFTILQLNRSVRYQVFVFVSNPSPAWSCPGYRLGDDMLYISAESLDGTPAELPRLAQFTIPEPTPYDCVTVTVTDDAGNPLPNAGLFVDEGFGPGLTDASGQVRLDVDPGEMYDLGAFIAGTGWPCPWVSDDGTEFHFAERRPVSAEELLDGETLVITKPEASDCPPPAASAEIRIFDDGHSTLPQAFIGICQYDPANPPSYPPGPVSPCDPATWWAGPGGDGVIRVAVDPERSYDITGYLSCVDGWFLFGEGNYTSAGYTVWRVSGADLLADGLEITIHGDIATCVGS